jgi:hypothetical protein
VTTTNGHADVVALEAAMEAPAAAPAKKRRARRTAAEMAAARAEKASKQASELLTLTIAGVEVKASAADAITLLRGLQAA